MPPSAAPLAPAPAPVGWGSGEDRTPARRSRRVLGAASAALLTGPIVLTGTGPAYAAGSSFVAATPIPPPPTKALPAELDVAEAYQRGVLCLHTDQPGPVSLAKLLNANYGTHYYGIFRACDQEHGEGRALDWMVNANTPDGLALGNAITEWLSAPDAQGRPGAMARRFGIMYIIWNRHMWRAYDPARGWAPYSGASPHTDHIHISFSWDGANKLTSWWTGRALTKITTSGPLGSGSGGGTVTPPPPPPPPVVLTSTGYPVLSVGSTGAHVVTLQKALKVTADGDFGPITLAALKTWQQAQGLTVSGKADDTTWRKLIALKLAPPLAPPTTPPVTTPTTHPELAKYASLVLRLGSRGEAVAALQKVLRITNDGVFGTGTQAAVTTYQKTHQIPPTGVVAELTWRSLVGATTPPPVTPPPVTPPPTNPPPTTPPPTTPPGVTTVSLDTEFTPYLGSVLSAGASGPGVRLLQQSLGVATDGRLGPLTVAAIKGYQAKSGLPVTGVCASKTWHSLELRAHPLLPYWGVVLKVGVKGPAVLALQKAVGVKADGTFGETTVAAVKAAQAKAGLARTGVVGTQTWKALERQLAGR